jgi:hypothetical protein
LRPCDVRKYRPIQVSDETAKRDERELSKLIHFRREGFHHAYCKKGP